MPARTPEWIRVCKHNLQDNLCDARKLTTMLIYLCCCLWKCATYSDLGCFFKQPEHQTTVMFNFLFSKELVLSRGLRSLLLQGLGALLTYLPISLQSPLAKGYLDLFLEKSLIIQGNDTIATFTSFLSLGVVNVSGMHFFVVYQHCCQSPYSLYNIGSHIL